MAVNLDELVVVDYIDGASKGQRERLDRDRTDSGSENECASERC